MTQEIVAQADMARDRVNSRDIPGALDAISDEFAVTVSIAGTPDEARKQAAEWLEFLDCAFFLTPAFGATDDEVAANRRALIETFGR